MGGTYHFYFWKWSTGAKDFGNFRNFDIGKVALSQRKNTHNFWTKIASAFVKVSIESSEIRAFDRAFIEGATIFGFGMRVEILGKLWNPLKTSILDMTKMAPEHEKIADFWKVWLYSRKHQQSTQLIMYYIGRSIGFPKIDVSGGLSPKITVFSRFQRFSE